MSFISVVGKEDILSREEEILDLFKVVFGKTMLSATWRWFYVENPVGEAAISLYYEDNHLIGHYAAVPIRLRIRGESTIAYRSMTTMVHPKGQGKGLFVNLARHCYSGLTERGYPLVFGFPNQNSAHGFQKHLGWKLYKPDFVTDVMGADILSSDALQASLFHDADCTWDYQDTEQMEWRFSAPGENYEIYPGLRQKEYQGISNILHISRSGLQFIDPDKTYRVLVDSSLRDHVDSGRPSFDYLFGFCPFKPDFAEVRFKRELILSDVF